MDIKISGSADVKVNTRSEKTLKVSPFSEVTQIISFKLQNLTILIKMWIAASAVKKKIGANLLSSQEKIFLPST